MTLALSGGKRYTTYTWSETCDVSKKELPTSIVGRTVSRQKTCHICFSLFFQKEKLDIILETPPHLYWRIDSVNRREKTPQCPLE